VSDSVLRKDFFQLTLVKHVFIRTNICAHIRGKIINILTEMGHLYVQKENISYFIETCALI